MESGILDHLNIAPLNEDTHKPSQLHYGSDIDAIRGTGAALGKLKAEELSDGVLNGDNRDEGESSALGCERKEATITVTTVSGDSETFFSSPAAFCPTVFARKEVQSKYPASHFSGKLRLMVQAMYGSKRTDYKMSESLENLSPLSVENGSLTWTYTNNNGLFSGRNYEYFMIRVNGDGVYAQKLKVRGAGKKLQEYLQNNTLTAARERRYETYLLSLLFYDENGEWTKIGESGDAYDHGSPWYFGWSWNMDGSEARAVTIEKKDDDNEPKIWESTAFTLTITETTAETIADGRLTASVATREATQEFSFGLNTDMVWFPNDLGAGMRPFIPHDTGDGGPDAGDVDVPMYDVYDYANDKFDTVRFKRTDLGSGDDVFGGNVPWGDSMRTPDACSDYGCHWQSTATSAVEKGFYVDGYSSWSGVDKAGEGVQFGGREAGVTGDWSPGTSFPFGGLECTGTVSNSVELISPASGSELRVDGDFNLQTLLIVPYDDCDSVYLGFWNRFDGDIQAWKTLPGADVVNGFITGGEEHKWAWSWDQPSNITRWILKDRAAGQGLLETADENGTLDDMDIRYFANGADVEVHLSRGASSEALSDSVRFPSCIKETFKPLEEQDWVAGAFDKGGYDDFFDPVLFPEPQFVSSVTSRSSANFQSYHASKNPGGSDELINDGTYSYEEIDDNLFSYVGFA